MGTSERLEPSESLTELPGGIVVGTHKVLAAERLSEEEAKRRQADMKKIEREYENMCDAFVDLGLKIKSVEEAIASLKGSLSLIKDERCRVTGRLVKIENKLRKLAQECVSRDEQVSPTAEYLLNHRSGISLSGKTK